MEKVLFENILDNVDLPIVLLDNNGQICYQNNSFKKLCVVNINELESYNEKYLQINNETYKLITINSENQLYQDFLSTVSHELRTPLTSIRGFADTMLVSGDKLTNEQRMKFLSIIKNQANRLTRLIENLLEVSKISRKIKLIKKEINFKTFISPLIVIFEKKYPNCTYQINIEQNLPFLWTDSDLLEQIMTNLLDNASKYSMGNPIININAYSQNNELFIEICDEAEKIPETHFGKIFNKFARIDSPLTRKVEGTGLGLFITKSLIEKLDGNIYVSHSQKGNVFSLKFPICSIEQQLNSKILGES